MPEDQFAWCNQAVQLLHLIKILMIQYGWGLMVHLYVARVIIFLKLGCNPIFVVNKICSSVKKKMSTASKGRRGSRVTLLECDFVFGWLDRTLSWKGFSDEGTGEAHRGAPSLHSISATKTVLHFNMQHLCRESLPKWLLLRGWR